MYLCKSNFNDSWISGEDLVVAEGVHLAVLGAHKEVGASVASFVNMFEPVTSVIVSFLLYHDPLTGRIVAGILLVLSAVLFVAVGDRKENA